jgi:hypothetical protein
MVTCLVRFRINSPSNKRRITRMTLVFFFRRRSRGPSSTVTVVRILRLIGGGTVLHPSVQIKLTMNGLQSEASNRPGARLRASTIADWSSVLIQLDRSISCPLCVCFVSRAAGPNTASRTADNGPASARRGDASDDRNACIGASVICNSSPFSSPPEKEKRKRAAPKFRGCPWFVLGC